MHKLKIKNLNKAIEKLTDNELRLYIYIVHRQDEFGSVRGILYKECMRDLYISKQGFYNAFYSLGAKGFITIDYSNSKGWNCYVINNQFTSKKDYKEGYVNLNVDFIHTKEFMDLSVNIKKFILRLIALQCVNGKKIKLSKDTLKGYLITYNELEVLETYFHIKYIREKELYIFTLKREYGKVSKQDYYTYFKHLIENYCNIFKISYTIKTLEDTIKLFNRFYRKKKYKLIKAFDECIKKHTLEPRLINYICSSCNK